MIAESILLGASVALQFFAAFMALRLIRVMGGHFAWIMIAAALGLMGARRSITLYRILLGDPTITTDLSAELVALGISVLMVAGVAGVAPVMRAFRGREEARAAAERKTQMIVDNVVHGIITLKESGIVESFNGAAERIFDYTAEEMIGQNISVLIDAGERAQHDFFVQRYLQTGQRRVIGQAREVLGRRRDGSLIPLELQFNELRLPVAGKEELGAERRIFIGSLYDLTDRKRADARFSSLAAAVPVVIFETDAEGNCVYVNERWSEIAGMSREEASGSGWRDALHPDDRVRMADAWYQAAATGATFEQEYRFQRSEGSTSWVYGQAVPPSWARPAELPAMSALSPM